MSKPTSLAAEEDVLDPGTLVDDFSKCSLCGLNLGPGSSKYISPRALYTHKYENLSTMR